MRDKVSNGFQTLQRAKGLGVQALRLTFLWCFEIHSLSSRRDEIEALKMSLYSTHSYTFISRIMMKQKQESCCPINPTFSHYCSELVLKYFSQQGTALGLAKVNHDKRPLFGIYIVWPWYPKINEGECKCNPQNLFCDERTSWSILLKVQSQTDLWVKLYEKLTHKFQGWYYMPSKLHSSCTAIGSLKTSCKNQIHDPDKSEFTKATKTWHTCSSRFFSNRWWRVLIFIESPSYFLPLFLLNNGSIVFIK